jgi:hypothetical protein
MFWKCITAKNRNHKVNLITKGQWFDTKLQVLIVYIIYFNQMQHSVKENIVLKFVVKATKSLWHIPLNRF